jgi:hypothetical protein
MLSLHALYPLVQTWLQALELPCPPLALSALAHLVGALLCGQSLRPSALMWALLSPQAVPARQRYKRVARLWERPWLTPAGLTPLLVRAALALVDSQKQESNCRCHTTVSRWTRLSTVAFLVLTGVRE